MKRGVCFISIVALIFAFGACASSDVITGFKSIFKGAFGENGKIEIRDKGKGSKSIRSLAAAGALTAVIEHEGNLVELEGVYDAATDRVFFSGAIFAAGDPTTVERSYLFAASFGSDNTFESGEVVVTFGGPATGWDGAVFAAGPGAAGITGTAFDSTPVAEYAPAGVCGYYHNVWATGSVMITPAAMIAFNPEGTEELWNKAFLDFEPDGDDAVKVVTVRYERDAAELLAFVGDFLDIGGDPLVTEKIIFDVLGRQTYRAKNEGGYDWLYGSVSDFYFSAFHLGAVGTVDAREHLADKRKAFWQTHEGAILNLNFTGGDPGKGVASLPLEGGNFQGISEWHEDFDESNGGNYNFVTLVAEGNAVEYSADKKFFVAAPPFGAHMWDYLLVATWSQEWFQSLSPADLEGFADDGKKFIFGDGIWRDYRHLLTPSYEEMFLREGGVTMTPLYSRFRLQRTSGGTFSMTQLWDGSKEETHTFSEAKAFNVVKSGGGGI
jgi:hypothetical protein